MAAEINARVMKGAGDHSGTALQMTPTGDPNIYAFQMPKAFLEGMAKSNDSEISYRARLMLENAHMSPDGKTCTVETDLGRLTSGSQVDYLVGQMRAFNPGIPYEDAQKIEHKSGQVAAADDQAERRAAAERAVRDAQAATAAHNAQLLTEMRKAGLHPKM